jgi:tetrahydromethanopterin S-methyltransferase subunit G
MSEDLPDVVRLLREIVAKLESIESKLSWTRNESFIEIMIQIANNINSHLTSINSKLYDINNKLDNIESNIQR